MRPCKEHDDLGCPMTRINRVDGRGPSPCRIMLIAGAPGKVEDKKGKASSGKAGSELENLYLPQCAKVDWRNVYITKVVKCRTNEKDRAPNADELSACGQLLIDELFKQAPKFVGTIGSLSTRFLLGDDARIDKMHGFAYPCCLPSNGDVDRHNGFEFMVMPLYHPSYGLSNTAMMRHIMEDFERFGKMVRGDESVMWKEHEYANTVDHDSRG